MSRFTPGRNIAMKLPERHYHDTLGFYRETLGLKVLSEDNNGAVIDFGAVRLNLDRVPAQSQTDIWLQVTTDDTDSARRHLETKGVTICNEVEDLPTGFDGFWIAAPGGTIHLIDGKDQAKEG